MTFTLCTSGSAIVKAGTHANSTIILSGTAMANYSLEAEGLIESETRIKWVENHATLPTGIKGVLSNELALISLNSINRLITHEARSKDLKCLILLSKS